MLNSIEQTKKQIESGKYLLISAEEEVLKKLPKGNWVGGSIPYFMDEKGGVFTKELVSIIELPSYITGSKIKWYDEGSLSTMPKDAPENGFTYIVIPATSKAHISYAQNAPSYEGIFMKPTIGWISGVDLADLGKKSPKVVNGQTLEFSDQKAIVMHCALPVKKVATIGIINIFEQGTGDVITFDQEGFSVQDCMINGKKTNFAEYLTSNKINTQLPLVANYSGTMVNVSFQEIKVAEKTVNLYAPVFKKVEYKIAKPVKDYVADFTKAVPKQGLQPIFSCNCILNYLYSQLEGKKTANLMGPITFGEIAYQLLNQTLTYLEVKDI